MENCGLALLASLFVLINAIRNRRSDTLTGNASIAKGSLIGAAATNLVSAVAFVAVFAMADLERLIFDFPPAGMGTVLVLPVLATFLTAGCLVMLVPVWGSPDYNVWRRLRYTYVTGVFVLLILVMWYWNLIGWNY